MKPQVIEIPSDCEQEQIYKAKEIYMLQKQIQDEANLVRSNTGIMLAINKKFIEGSPKEKQQKLAERIKKMFIDKQNFDISKEYFCLKREPQYNLDKNDVVLQQIMVFGVDFWPSKQIKKDARSLQMEVEVVKIDDSHCKLKFASYQNAIKWLDFYILDKAVKSKIEEDANQYQQQAPQVKIQNINKLKGWFKLQNYYYQGFERTREARFCTQKQKDIKQLLEQTRTTNYQKFKEQIQRLMLDNQNAKISYEMAQQRNRHQRRRKDKDRSRNYQRRNQDSYHARGSDRSRQKNMRRYNNDYRRNRQDGKNLNMHSQKNLINKTMIYSYPETRRAANTVNKALYQSNVLEQLNMQSSLVNNTLPIDNNNQNINLITDALNQMDLEDGQLDLSLQIGPSQIKQKLDLSVQISQKVPNQLQKNAPTKQENKKTTYHRVYDKSFFKKDTQNSGFGRNKENTGKKETETDFDYVKYIQQSQKQAI